MSALSLPNSPAGPPELNSRVAGRAGNSPAVEFGNRRAAGLHEMGAGMTVAGVVTSAAVELTAEEYLVAWQHLRLGLVHWNLQLPGGAAQTVEERMAAHRQAWDELRARGFADARKLVPELADLLQLIARPVIELNARLDEPDGPRTVVGCARGEHAVLAELNHSVLRLQLARASALPAAVARAMPDRPMGSGTAVSVPAELLPEKQGLTGMEVERALARGGTRLDDARRFRSMLQGPKLSGGKFGAARYDRQGSRHIAEFVVTYYDTPRGGYTIEQKRRVDRSRWFTLAPAGRTQLAERLSCLLDSVRT